MEREKKFNPKFYRTLATKLTHDLKSFAFSLNDGPYLPPPIHPVSAPNLEKFSPNSN
jgi:hypothetical protein